MLEICVGQISEAGDPERMIAVLAIVALGASGLYALVRWFRSQPVNTDPWDAATANELAEGECTPLCHHCLAPHDPAAYFCGQCGAAIGACTNMLPFPYVFSLGQGLRIGTSENFRRTPFVVAGFVVFAAALYGPFAPVYWFRLVQNLRRPPTSPGSSSDEQPAADGSPVQPPGSEPG